MVTTVVQPQNKFLVRKLGIFRVFVFEVRFLFFTGLLRYYYCLCAASTTASCFFSPGTTFARAVRRVFVVRTTVSLLVLGGAFCFSGRLDDIHSDYLGGAGSVG